MSIFAPGLHAPPEWWRRVPDADPSSHLIRLRASRSGETSSASTVLAKETPAGRLAFRGLIAFTAILMLSPQAWFPVLGALRIAFLAAGVAIGAHLFDRLVHSRDAATPMPREIVIALALVAWAVMTLPLSYWPAGSVEVLADRYIKAIAFFWLIGTVVNSSDRLRVLAWTLVLCSIPLAATGVRNYFSGEVLSTGVRGFTRIYGYGVEGSGLAANPNDLALMLNLIIPVAAALIWTSRRALARLVAAGALTLAVAGVIVTFSRAGFLALAGSAVMFTFVLARRKAVGAAVGIVVLTLAVLPLLPTGYVDRLSTITNIEADATGSAAGRWRDTQVAFGVMLQNAVFGVGIGQDVLAMNSERGDTWRRIHNAYLQYGVDLGVLGLLLFVWLHVKCIRTARAVERHALRDPARRHLAYLAAGVQVSLVVFGIEAMFHPIAYNFYFFCIGGLAVALKQTWRAEALPRGTA